MMEDVVAECRRILKPNRIGCVRPSTQRRKDGQDAAMAVGFVVWAGEKWNLVEDAYWWNPTAIPSRGEKRELGLMRPSVKMCVWLGSPDCYRNQDGVLWTPSDALATKRREDMARRIGPSGGTCRNSTIDRRSRRAGRHDPVQSDPDFSDQPTGRCRTSSCCHALRCCRLVVPIYSSPWRRPSRSILRQRHDAGGRSRPRCVESHRHRQREKVSGDCEAADHKGVKYHRIPSRSATRTILASTNACSNSSTNFFGSSIPDRN